MFLISLILIHRQPVCCLLALFVGAMFLTSSGHDAIADDPGVWQLPSQGEREATRVELAETIDDLNRWLGNSANGDAWREYLLWDALIRSNGVESNTDFIMQLDSIGDLRSIYNRLTDDLPGLEHPRFQGLREGIRNRVIQLNAITTRRGERESIARRVRLDELLKESYWTAEAQGEYLQHLRWLDDRGQEIPAAWIPPSRPNLEFRIRAEAVGEVSSMSVTEPTSINECIVGTRVLGNGVTRGNAWIQLAPNRGGDEARLLAHFNGRLTSDTVGYNGPVRVYSDGFTTLRGEAELRVSDQGLRLVSTRVNASASSQTKGISTKFSGVLDRVIKRVAKKQIAQKKGQADRESTRKAQVSFRDEFEQDLREQVQQGDDLFQRYLRLPLLRRDLMPTDWTWDSSTDALTTSLHFTGRRDLCASVPVPFSTSNQHIQVLCHQSFLENACEGYLAGRFVDLDSLADPDEVDAPIDSEIAIRLSDEQPLRCEFDHDELKLRLQCGQIVVDGTEYSSATIFLHYRVVVGEKGLLLQQVAKPVLEPAPRYGSKPSLGVRGSALRSVVEPILQQDLPAELELSLDQLGDEIPEELKGLRICGLSTRNGWLQLTLNVLASP